ncbi:MAG: hypothetical protein V4714_02410 [Bacteroidota bacterium]
MSLFRKRAPFVLIITALLGLVSCQEKENILPATDMSTTAGARVQSTDALTIPMVHTLTNRGDVVLSYGADGKLNKVEDYNFVQFISYPFDNALVTYKSVYANDSLKGKFMLSVYLNAEKRVTKTELVTTFPKTLRTHTELFEYYPSGQLSKHYDKNSPSTRAVYGYNADGDLSLVTYYNGAGTVIKKVNLYYIGFGNDPLLNDKYALNPEFDIFDIDLRIYGKFSKNLARRITIKVYDITNPNALKLQSDYYYSYLLDANGYATQRDCYNLNGANLVNSVKYLYSLSPLVLKF